jgi:hypothetical protein
MPNVGLRRNCYRSHKYLRQDFTGKFRQGRSSSPKSDTQKWFIVCVVTSGDAQFVPQLVGANETSREMAESLGIKPFVIIFVRCNDAQVPIKVTTPSDECHIIGKRDR